MVNTKKTDKQNKILIHDLFLGLQDEMTASLITKRKGIKHPGAKGSSTETSWLKMLKTYLPKRYDAEKAFVLDSKGNISDEIDIVIFDRQYSPFLFNHDGALYIPAESVYCVIEVKPSFNKEVLEYAGKKAGSVRRLYRTSAPIPHAGGQFKPKKLFNIISGIVVLDSEWSPAFGKPFENCLQSLDLKEKIDFGCVLKEGSFFASYSKKGLSIQKSNSKTSLIYFFLKLLSELQKIGTVPAIKIDEYWKII